MAKGKILNEEGQAIFELIAFVPILLVLLNVFTNVSGAINGSINQQKATRGYYYHLDKGNSFFPARYHLARGGISGFERVEYFAVGWQEREESKLPIAACYRMQIFLGNQNVDTCEEPEETEQKTQFIRPYTVYGVCGANFARAGRFFINNWRNPGGSCSVQ